jgi:DnaJ family protein C protein 22
LFAGYFGVGWLRDLWRLPEYVKDANSDPAYEKELSKKMKETEIPPWKTARWMGMLRKCLGTIDIKATCRH